MQKGVNMKAAKPCSGHLVERKGYYHTVINAYIDGHRRPISRTTGLPVKNNLRKAQKILEERKQEFDTHGITGMLAIEEKSKTSSMLLSEYMTRVIKKKEHELSPITLNGYRQMIDGRIKRFFDPRRISIASITPQLIEDFLDSIAEDGCNGSTQIRYYQIIGECLKYAMRKDHISANPMDKVDRPKKNKFRASFYSKDEAMKLLEAAKGDPLYMPILLGIFYGLRRSEAVGLQWSSVDFENNLLHVDHKAYEQVVNGKTKVFLSSEMKTESSLRTLPLIPFVREELLAHKARQEEYKKSFRKGYCKDWADCVCVFPTGEIVPPGYISSNFKRFLIEKGLRPIRYHDLRHSCASMLVAQGVPMKQIQLWMGHSTYSTTADIYSHLSSESLNESASCMEGLLAPKSSQSSSKV